MFYSEVRKTLISVRFHNDAIEKRFWELADDTFKRANAANGDCAFRFSFHWRVFECAPDEIAEKLRPLIKQRILERLDRNELPPSFSFTADEITKLPFSAMYRWSSYLVGDSKFFLKDAIDSDPHGRAYCFMQQEISRSGTTFTPTDHAYFHPEVLEKAVAMIADISVGQSLKHCHIVQHRLGFDYELETTIMETDVECDFTEDLLVFIEAIKTYLSKAGSLTWL